MIRLVDEDCDDVDDDRCDDDVVEGSMGRKGAVLAACKADRFPMCKNADLVKIRCQ
jgi:hypothetical protein